MNEELRREFALHQEQLLAVVKDLRDIAGGKVDPDAVPFELGDLAGHVEAIARRIGETEKLVFGREPPGQEERDYHVRGKYVALYPDNSQSSEIAISIIQPAANAGAAIQQVATDAVEEYGYLAIAWLSIASDLVEDGQP